MTYDPKTQNPPPRDSGGGHNALYFIVGGLVVLAGVFVFLFTNEYIGSGARDGDVNVAPAAEPVAPPPAEPAQPAPATGGTTTTQ
jgi:hypothetical protein